MQGRRGDLPSGALTNRRDRLHELVLFEFEEDGGFSGSIQTQSHNADLHLGTYVDPVVLEQRESTWIDSEAARRGCEGGGRLPW